MSESEERQHAEHNDQHTSTQGGPEASPLSPPPDDVYRVLENFESNLKGLKSMYTERQVIQAKLQEREVGLLLREKELSSRAGELDAVKAQIEEMRLTVEIERESLAARDAQVAQRETQLSASADEMEKGLAELRQKNEELKRWADEHDRRKAELAAESDMLAQARAEVEASKPRIANARREIEQAARAMAEVENRRIEIATEAKKVADARAEVESLQMRLETARDEIEEAQRFQASIEKRRAELDAQAARLNQDRQAFDAANAGLVDLVSKKAMIEGELAVLDAKKGRAESLADALSAMEQSLTDQAQELERLKVELNEARASVNDRASGLSDQSENVARLERELGEMREIVQEYEQLWTIEREHAVGLMVQLQEQSARAEQQLAQAAAAAPTVLPAAPDTGASREEIEQLEALVGELKDRLRTEIAARREAEELATAPNPDADQARLDAEEKLERSLAQLSKAQAEIERLRTDAPSFSTPAQEATLQRRRDRLREAKRLIRQKQEKLRVGGEALRKRFEQCEEVFKQRAELSAVAERVKAADRKNQKTRARGRIASVVLCWMLILGIMAGLSYAVSRQVIPGVYVAKTTMKADGRGRELTDGERREWQTFHENMLADPRFADVVAKRMARKGMASTSDPGAITDLVRNRLVWESPAPGELRLELKGEGATKTERELDTISTALAGEANAARTNQAHAAVTTSPTPATTNGMPLDNSQLIAAGAMLGVGFVILVCIAMAMYRKLAQAKTRFERDAELAGVLNDENWPTMDQVAA